MIDPQIIVKGLDRIEALLAPLGDTYGISTLSHAVNNARQIVGALKTMIELDKAGSP